MSFEALQEAVSKSRKDSFDTGTVVKWTASDKYQYAAIKTDIGWFTTARSVNSFVPQRLDFDELLEILGRAETSDVAVATAWTAVQ